MADAMPGAAPAPTMEDFAAFEQIRQEVSPSELNETLLATAAEADPMAVAEFKSELRDLDLPAEVLDALDGMVDEILATPERYAEIRAHYLTQDMSEELLPEAFDPEFFGALSIALDEIRATSGGPARAPQGFAHGGIASLGRNGDTMLAHVTPAEMRMLKDKGGAGTINPRTGLPEFFSLKKVFSKIGRAVKKFARSTVGKIVISTALFMIAGPMAATALGITNPIAVAAVSGFVAGTGSSLAAGGSLKDSLKAGAIGGITAGAVQGVSTALGGPSITGGDNNAPIIESAPVIESTGVNTGTLTTAPEMLVPTPASPGLAAPPAGDIIRQDLMTPAVTPVNSGVASLPSSPNVTADMYMNAVSPQGAQAAQGVTADMYMNAVSPQGVQSAASTLPTEAPGFFESIKETFTPDRTLAERGTSLKEAFLPGKGPSVIDVLKDSGIDPMNATAAQLEVAKATAASAATNLGRRYLPLAAAGVGVMGLAGGFDAPESEMPDGFGGFMDAPGQRLLDKYPERYALNFGGVRPMGSSGYTTYTPAPYVPPTYNAAQGSGPSGVAQEFPRMDGPINGPGTGTSDDVPAMLSDGEFVFTAKAVRNMGNGSRRKGAKKMYALMKKLEGTA